VTKQLRKLIDVVRVTDLSGENIITRELALMRVRATPATRSEIIQLVDIFRATIVDVAHDSLIIEVTGDQEKLDSLHYLLKPFGVREVMRSGRLAMARGDLGGGNGRVRRTARRLAEDEELEPQQPAIEPPS